MISVRLNGGLGNQLFEYAAARAVSIRNQTSLELDLRFYHEKVRGTAKGVWITDLPVKARVKSYSGAVIGPHNPVRRFLERAFVDSLRQVYHDGELGYDPAIQRVGGNAVLIGLFQSYRYFADHWQQISTELDFSRFADLDWLHQQTRPWTAIHVRRGDYVGDPRFEMKDPESYYSAAIETVLRRNPSMSFVVFSDDIRWCREQAWLRRCEFYAGRDGRHPAVDLATMARANTNIIGNSSYSWWSGWAGNRDDKLVIAPSLWVDGLRSTEIDLIPPGWETLEWTCPTPLRPSNAPQSPASHFSAQMPLLA